MFAWHRARLRRNTALSRRAVLECGRCEMGYSTRREEPFSIRTCRGCALFHRVNRPGETAGESPHGGRGTASPRGPRPRGGSARAGRGGRRARAFRRWRRRPTARPLRPRAALTGGVPNVSPRNTGAHEARGNGREGGAAASRAPRRPRRSSSTHHCTVSTAADGRVRVADQTGTVLGFPSARLACGPRPGGARSQRAMAKEFPPPPPGHPWRPAAGHPPTRWPRAQSRQEFYAATVKRPCPLSRPRAVERTVTARRRDPWHARPLAVREGNCAGRGEGGRPLPAAHPRQEWGSVIQQPAPLVSACSSTRHPPTVALRVLSFSRTTSRSGTSTARGGGGSATTRWARKLAPAAGRHPLTPSRLPAALRTPCTAPSTQRVGRYTPRPPRRQCPPGAHARADDPPSQRGVAAKGATLTTRPVPGRLSRAPPRQAIAEAARPRGSPPATHG